MSVEQHELSLEGYELSPEQRRAFKRDRSRRPMRIELRFDGEIDRERTLRALRDVAARHEILRTRIVELPGVQLPVQQVEPELALRTAGAPRGGFQGMTLEIARSAERAWRVSLELPPVLDAAGSWQLVDAWASAYRGEELPEPSLQYADYAAWRNQRVTDEGAAHAAWSNTLVAHRAGIKLPFRQWAEPSAPSLARATLALPLSAQLAAACTRVCREHALDPALLALGAFASLLGRHADQDQLGIGLDWQARPPYVGDALGMFFEPLPLDVRLSDASDLVGLARWLRERSDALLEWREYYPRADEPNAAPVGFRYVPRSRLQLRALREAGFSVEKIALPATEHALCLQYTGSEEGWSLELEYDAHRYDFGSICLIGDQLQSLLDSFCREPRQRLEKLSLLSETERALLAEQWTASPAGPSDVEARYRAVLDQPSVAHCLGRFDPSLASAPALAGTSARVSYAELAVRSDRWARELAFRGARPGCAVGHFVPRGPDAVVAMLAILKCGAAYVPIDPSAPAARTQLALEQCAARWVVSSSELRQRLPEPWQSEDRFVCEPASATESPTVLPRPEPADTAYIIFTSGSTGAPKGVVITQSGALHSLAARAAFYPGAIARFLLVSPFAFDSSIAGLFATLLDRGCLFVCSEEEARDAAQLAAIVEAESITHALFLPSLYQLVLAELDPRRCQLQAVIVAGEACSPELIATHQELLPETHLYNEYGPSEAAVWSTVAQLTDHRSGSPVPIGRPIPHTRAFVLDAQREPVARGVRGELYVSGPGLSPGYLGQPELTRERFSEWRGERVYRTGDHAYCNERGEFVFVGRADQQVKVRGHRVELPEVEAALLRVSEAEHAVVLAAHSASGEVRLRAFLELRAEREPEVIARALAMQLPAPMVPAEIVVLPRLPRTANGKIDRQALAARAPSQRRTPYVAPRGHLEKALAKHFRELLGAAHVGRDDDFFALGGHSLLVVRLVHRVRTELGVEARVGTVFEHPRLAQLAAALDRPPEAGLIQLRAGEPDQRPLFCLHESYGDIHHYFALLPALAQSKPVLGIPLAGQDVSEGARIESLAEGYCSVIRARQPRGPYELCGYSLGGVLAHAIAGQLEAAGERVRFLGLFDATFTPGVTELTWPELLRVIGLELVADDAARLADLPEPILRSLREATQDRGVVQQLRAAFFEWAPAHGLALSAPPEVLRATLSAMRNARVLLDRYQPPTVGADLELFTVEASLAQDPALVDRWRACTTGQLRENRVPGDHNDMLSQPALHETLAFALSRVSP